MGGFGHRYVVGLLAGFCSRYPKVTLEYSTSQYTPDLLAEGIDVSVYLTRQLSDSGLIALRLGRTFSVLCAAPAYFESQGMPNHPRELTSHACIRLINPSASTDWALRSGSEAYRVQPKGPLIGDNPDVLLNATEQGSGVALLPIFTVIDSIRSGRLVRALPLWRSEEIGVFALYPSRRFLDAKTKAWLDLLKTHVAPMLEADAMQFQ
jgi:DNA-binding transcriptional LysR family regulator